MNMDSTLYTIMYNDNSGMYHEPRHKFISISVSTCTCMVNMSTLASIKINTYLVEHKCFNNSIVNLFLITEHRNYLRIFTNKYVFYWTEDSKTYAHADA